MGIQAAKAYLTRIHYASTEDLSAASGALVMDPLADADQQISYLLTIGHALGVNLKVLTALLIDPADDSDAQIAAVLQAERVVKRRSRPVERRPIRITERDLDMLYSLAIGRLLQVEALEWLHFPTWRTRYNAYDDQLQVDSTAHYHPTTALYTRLNALRGLGYVQRITRTIAYASTRFVRVPDVYALTEAGVDVLGHQRGIPADQLWAEDLNKRAIQNLEHTIAIGRLYAALRCAAAYRGGATISAWQGDHLLAPPHAYDRIPVRGYRMPLPVQPDATALLTTPHGTQRVFVEMDRGTRPVSTWATKIAAYHAYSGSPQLHTRYGTADFVVLTIAPNPQRLARITEEMVKCLGEPHDRYLFLAADDMHPTTIRAYWQRVSQVTWQRRAGPTGSVVQVPTVKLEQVPLWTNP